MCHFRRRFDMDGANKKKNTKLKNAYNTLIVISTEIKIARKSKNHGSFKIILLIFFPRFYLRLDNELFMHFPVKFD